MGDFMAKAKEVCATANTDQPFMCLDLTYISVLLKDGYGLNAKTKVKVNATQYKSESIHSNISLTSVTNFVFPFAVVQANKQS